MTTINAQETFSHYNEITPTITGQLNGYDSAKDTNLILSFTLVTPSADAQKGYAIQPEPDGSFRFEMPYPVHYSQIWFRVLGIYYGQLIIDKGLTITIDLDPLWNKEGQYASKHVQFSGVDGALNTYINKYTTYEIKKRDKDAMREKQMMLMDNKLSEQERVKRLKAFYDSQRLIAAQFAVENPSPYSWILDNELRSDFFGEIFIIHWGKEMPEALFEEAMAHQPKLISNSGMMSYYGYLFNYFFMPLRNDRITNYRDFLLPTIDYPEERARLTQLISLLEKQKKKEEIDTDLLKRELRYFRNQYKDSISVISYRRTVEVIDQLPPEKADMIRIAGGGRDIWSQALYLENTLDGFRTDWVKAMAQKQYESLNKQKASITNKLKEIRVTDELLSLGNSIGTLKNGAELYFADQASLDSLLSGIRSAYPQKAIILDIWAPWCGPCISDMRKSNENIQKLRAQDIEVVYLCVEEATTQEIWKKKVAELDLNTKHFFLNTKLSAEIMDFFNLSGFPSHVVLDKEGNYRPDLLHSISRIDLEEVVNALK